MSRKICIFIALLALLIIAALPAQAGTSTFIGVITGSEPEAYEVDNSACTTIETFYHFYQTFSYTVTATGLYSYSDLSLAYAMDMQLTIYQGSYDPDNVLTNCVVKMDDSDSVNLTAGVVYTFVVQPLYDWETGIWEYSMTGPGDVIEAPSSSRRAADERPVFTDGRIARYDFAAPVVIFPWETASGIGLAVYSDEGEALLFIEAEAFGNCPSENTLIASHENPDVWIYRLSSCEYQINATQYNGKTYVLRFSEINASASYVSYEID